MTGRIREILFDDGVDATGTVIEAASQAYVDAKFDPVEPSDLGIWLDNTSGLPTLSPWRAGVLAWDTEHDCLAVSTVYEDSWLQVGSEEQETIRNKTGSDLTNGQVVYFDGATGHIPEVKLATCTDENIAKKTIGLITSSDPIANNGTGPICLSGHVHGINTNAYTVGDILWLDTVAGNFTATMPSYQYEHIMIGIVLEKSPTDGVIYVAVRDLTDQIAKMGFHTVDPHGWTEYDNTYMTRSWAGNTFTLTQVGASTPYYHKGKLKYLTGNKSIAITPTAGAHFIGLNCTTEVLEDLGGTIPAASVVSTHVLCEFCYADGTNVIYKANERHSTKFLKRDWFYKHLYLSTQYRTGITPSITSIDGNGDSITHAQFSVTTGIISDEDIDITIAALAAGDSKSIWYYNGTVWVNTAQATGAGVLTAGTGRAAYNNIASGLVECTNNYHVLTHIFAANDGTVICIVGNSQYQLLNAARIAASTEIATLLTTGLPFPEFRAIATFINKTSNTYSNAVKSIIVSVDTGVPFIDWRKTALNPVAGQSASNHQNLAGLQGGQAGEYYHLTAAQQTNIANNVFPSGTSTNSTNKILLPTNTTAGWSALTATESLIGWDSTKKKPVVGTGSAIVPIGGGLTPVSLSLSDFTGSPKKYAAESGKLYLVDMASAAEQYTITAPDGAAEVVFAVQCKNNENTSYLLTAEGFGGTDKFFANDTEDTTVEFSFPEMRVDFAWDSNDSHFLCAVSQTPTTGTWSGSLNIVDNLQLNYQNMTAYPTYRNLLINGCMRVYQRGTLFDSSGGMNNDDRYTLDRWYLLSDGNDIVDVTIQTDAPSNIATSKCMRLDVETANKKFGIAQIIEAKNCTRVIGGNATFSFYAKVSSTTKLDNIKAAIVSWSGTEDSVTSDIISSWGSEGTNPTLIANTTYENTPTNLGVTTSWARYTTTALIDTANTKQLVLFIWSDVTDTTVGDFLYLTGCQLEYGNYASPFEFRPFPTEITLCQRYYYRPQWEDLSPTSSTFAIGHAYGTTDAWAYFQFPCQMRIATTYLSYASLSVTSANGSDQAVTGASLGAQECGVSGALCRFTVASGLSTGNACVVRRGGVGTGWIAFNAEL